MNGQNRILIIEDEAGLLLVLKDRLAGEGYLPTTCSNGSEGFRLAREGHFDLIILDIMLPGMNGFDICRDLRKKEINTPILMLTAKKQVIDKVLGLKLGADDYLEKPFEVIELLARVEALLRRNKSDSYFTDEHLFFGDISVNKREFQVKISNEEVELSSKEFKLLVFLLEHRNKVFSRDELLDHVWGYNATPSTRTVDVHIASLRGKLEKNPKHPKHILTVHGLGYKFTG